METKYDRNMGQFGAVLIRFDDGHTSTIPLPDAISADDARMATVIGARSAWDRELDTAKLDIIARRSDGREIELTNVHADCILAKGGTESNPLYDELVTHATAEIARMLKSSGAFGGFVARCGVDHEAPNT